MTRRGLAFLVVIGVLVPAWYLFESPPWVGEGTEGHPGTAPHSHSHGELEPREVEPPYPTLSVEVVREGDRRVLRLRTERFRFVAPGETAPRAAHVGHGHLEVDDESVAMFYGDRYVLPRFQPGTYTLRVTLNGPDHAPLAVEGRVVADTVTLDVERTLPAPAAGPSDRPGTSGSG